MRLISVLWLLAALASGQRMPEYDTAVVRQIRIDLRDLGYPPLDVIPAGESEIRSLEVAPDGVLYGATSGLHSHLFRLDPIHGYVEPLGLIPGFKSVRHALAVSAAGDVYVGGDNGHLLKRTGTSFSDLGAPVEGESIYCLAADRERGVLYGLTSPAGKFFSYNLSLGRPRVFGAVADQLIPGEKFEREKAIGRALAVDRQGNVFTSGEGGRIVRFDYKRQKLERLAATVPTVPGREVYNRVDAWTIDQQGRLYGGGSDGYLFRLDPESLAVENLGKPLNQYRVRGLVFARNGKLYGAGGDDEEMARLFSYDPARGVYEMLGMIDVSRRPYYAWQAYVTDSMAVGLDGTIYIGQSERRSRLYVYYPE